MKGESIMVDEMKPLQPEPEQTGTSGENFVPEQVLQDEQELPPHPPELDEERVEPQGASVLLPSSSSPSFMDKLKRWAIYALAGLLAVSLIFLAGYLSSYFGSVRPLQASLALQAEELAGLETQIEGLESRNKNTSDSLASAQNQSATLKDEVASLKAELAQEEMRVLLLHTVNDFNAANLALANGDISGAKVALLATPERIETLLPLIETVDSPLAKNLENRFKMIQDNLEADSQTAQFDLGLLAKSLLNVETLLFFP
jgi:hypothetical protein